MGLRSDGEDKLGFQKTFFFFLGNCSYFLRQGPQWCSGLGFLFLLTWQGAWPESTVPGTRGHPGIHYWVWGFGPHGTGFSCSLQALPSRLGQSVSCASQDPCGSECVTSYAEYQGQTKGSEKCSSSISASTSTDTCF